MRIDWRRARVLTFDCYGTLIDWKTGILDVLRPWARVNAIEATDADLIGSYNAAEAAAQQENPKALYTTVLRSTMDRIAAAWNITSSTSARDTLASSVGDWPAFPDTAAALRQLQRHYKLVVVSNANGRLRHLFDRLGLAQFFDVLFDSFEEGVEKPDPRLFHIALARSGATAQTTTHVGDLYHIDVIGARAAGLGAVLIDAAGLYVSYDCPRIRRVSELIGVVGGHV